MAQEKIVTAFIKGNCDPASNEKWWRVLIYNPNVVLKEQDDSCTSSFELELVAAIKALQYFQTLERVDKLVIKTHSDYMAQGANKWLAGWKKNGWKKRNGEPVQNRERWEQFDAEMQAMGGKVCVEEPKMMEKRPKQREKEESQEKRPSVSPAERMCAMLEKVAESMNAAAETVSGEMHEAENDPGYKEPVDLAHWMWGQQLSLSVKIGELEKCTDNLCTILKLKMKRAKSKKEKSVV